LPQSILMPVWYWMRSEDLVLHKGKSYDEMMYTPLTCVTPSFILIQNSQ